MRKKALIFGFITIIVFISLLGTIKSKYDNEMKSQHTASFNYDKMISK